MPHNHSTRIRELFEKIQHNTATPEELRQFIALTEQADPADLLPFQEWEEAEPVELSPQLTAKIKRKALPRQPLLRRLLPYAAAAAVITLAVRLFWPEPTPEKWMAVTTRNGEIKAVWLPDSSLVTLNARSTLRYSLSENERTVYLEGQAFFDVRPNQQRPFMVRSGPLTTQVLGTSFDVRAYPLENTQVAVVTGKVKVATPKGESVILEQGLQAAYTPATSTISRFAADTAHMSSWQQGIINMNNLTLREVSTVLERWYGIEVVLETPGIDNYVLSGTQVNTDLHSTLESVCFIFKLQYTQDGNTIHISKK